MLLDSECYDRYSSIDVSYRIEEKFSYRDRMGWEYVTSIRGGQYRTFFSNLWRPTFLIII